MKSELRDPNTIVLSQDYAFVVARLYITSHRSDKPVSLSTLHNWRRAGMIPTAKYRPRGGRKLWFLKGADVINLLGVEPIIVAKPAAARARPSSVAALEADGFKNAR